MDEKLRVFISRYHAVCFHTFTRSRVGAHHTAQLSALVSTTGAFLVAALLAGEGELLCNSENHQSTTKCQTLPVPGVSSDSFSSFAVKSHPLSVSWHMGPPKRKENICINPSASRMRQTGGADDDDDAGTLVLEPHLHLTVEVREQGPQLSSWHSFSHR